MCSQRRTVLSRKQAGRAIEEQVLAANIDVLFIVSGLDHDYNERRIERYLVIARQSGARPVILLNKADLAESYGIDLAVAIARLQLWSGAPVVPLCALSSDGVSALDGLLAAGETAALIGSSGVGKSTIVNRLLGDQRQATREVRAGRRPRPAYHHDAIHVRHARRVAADRYARSSRGAVVGVARSSSMPASTMCANLRPAAGSATAPIPANPAVRCLTPDSTEARLGNYRKLQRELDYLDRKTDKRLMSETNARWKVDP